MAFQATSPFHIVAMIGFIISALTYVTHAFDQRSDVYVLIGMTVITLGYVFLFAGKLIAYRQGQKADAVKKTDEEHENPKPGSNVLPYFGYATLAIFFIGTFFFRQFTIHYRFYDVFGGIGYLMMMLTKYIPAVIPIACVLLYYFFGGIVKIWDEGWVNKAQMVARSMLVVYYGATLMSVMHLLR